MAPPSEALREWVSLLANLVVFLGVLGLPLAFIAFLRERRRDREDREFATFSSLSTSYIDYLRLCLEHPELQCVEARSVAADGDEIERKQELLLQIVISLLESAYFLYRDHDSTLREAQWKGWNEYMKDWCRHPEFRKRWPANVEQYDRSFRDHIARLYAEVDRGAP